MNFRKRIQEWFRSPNIEQVASNVLTRHLLANLPTVAHIAETGEHGAWLYISPRVKEMLGFSADEWMSDPDLWARQLHPDDRQRILADEARLSSDLSGQAIHWEYRFNCKDGRVVWLQDSAVLIWDADLGKKLWHGTFVDITARKHAEEEGQRLSRELTLLDDVRTAIAREVELSSLFHTVVESIVRAYGYSQVSIYLLEDGELNLAKQIGHGLQVEKIPLSRGVCGRVAKTGEPTYIPDVSRDPDFISDGVEILSEICVPLFDQSQIAGVLNVESDGTTRLSEDDFKLILTLSRQINIAITRARMYDDMQRLQAVTAKELTERRQAEAALAESEKRYHGVLNNMLEGCRIIGFDWRYIYVNDSAARQGGSNVDELIGNNMLELFPWIVNTPAFGAMRTCMETRKPIYMETEFNSPDGSPSWVQLSVQPVPEGIFILSVDITSRKQAERDTERLSREILLLDSVRSALAREVELPSLLRTVVESIARFHEFDLVSLYLLESNELILQHQVGYNAVIERFPINKGVMGKVARTAQPIFLQDVGAAPEFIGAIEGIISEICVPLFDLGSVVGVLNIESAHGNLLTETDMKLILALGEHINVALERARIYSDLQRKNQIESALKKSTLAVVGEMELSETLQSILAQAGSLLNSSDTYIYLATPDEDEIVVAMGTGIFAQYIGSTLKRGQGLAGKVWETGHALNVADYHTWSGRSARFEKIGFHPVLGTPLMSGTKVTGILGVARLEPERVFSNEDLELIGQFAQLASIALENARLFTLGRQELFERRQAEAALLESEKRFRAIFEQAPSGIAMVDSRTGQFKSVNTKYAEITGYSEQELLKLSFSDITHPDNAQFTVQDLAMLGEERIDSYKSQRRYVRKNGSIVWVEERSVALGAEGESDKLPYHMAIVEDITSRRQAEFLQIAVYRISEAATKAANVDDLFKSVHLIISQVMPANNFYIALYDSAREQLSFPYYVDEVDTSPPKTAVPLGQGLTEFVIFSGQALLCNMSTFEEMVRAGEVVEVGPPSPIWLGAPLIVDGRTIGAIALQDYSNPLAYGERELHMLEYVSAQVAKAIAWKDAEQALRESEQRYHGVLDDMLEGCRIIGFDWRYIYVNESAAKQGHSRVEDLIGQRMTELFPWIKNTEAFGAMLTCMETRVPIYMETELTLPDGTISWFELRIQPVPEGIFILSVDITARKQRERELQALASVSAALRTTSTRAEIMPIVLDQAMALFDARGATIILHDRLTGAGHVEAARGVWEYALGWNIPPGVGASGSVMSSGRPYVTANVYEDPLVFYKDVDERLPAFVSVPLSTANGFIGALNVGRVEAFTPEDVRALESVADIAANAMQRTASHELAVHRVSQLQALHNIDIAITSSLDLRVTLNVLLDHTVTQLSVDAACILKMTTSLHQLSFAAGRGFKTPENELAALDRSATFAGRVTGERRSIIIPDVRQESTPARFGNFLNREEFSSYIGVPLVAKGTLVGVLEVFHRSPIQATSEWVEFLETLATQAALAMDNAELFTGLQQSNLSLALSYDATIEGWSRALDLRDKETEGHTQRVTEQTLRLARIMQIPEEQITHIRRGALLHDIGKMGVPDSILLKPALLTEAEWIIMRHHPQYAYNLISPIRYLEPALDIPFCHHEKWDGSGYPRGLAGERIPLAARIFTVVDVWDALTSKRPYREAWPAEKVLDYIRENAGSHFEPKVVEVFLRTHKGFS